MIDRLGRDFLDFSWYSALGALHGLAIESGSISGDTLFQEIAKLVEAGLDAPDEQLRTATVTELLQPLIYPNVHPAARRYEQFLGYKGREYVKKYRQREANDSAES